MGISRGKQFENCIYSALNRVKDVSVDRVHDQMSGYKGSTNICDFVAYKYPNQYYIECKSHYGNTLPFSDITDNQWNGLLSKSSIPGVISGYMIWFIDHDITVFVNADAMRQLKDSGEKSFNIRKSLDKIPSQYYIVPGVKKRILFEYDLSEFLGD